MLKEFLSVSFKNKVFVYLVVFLIVLTIANQFNQKDDTDPIDGRSGFQLMTDSKTGCQYLQAGYFGGITPRVDRSGKHICN